MASTTMYQDSMLVVKGKCGDEIRRIPILNRELTYDELCFMMNRLFRSRLSNNLDNLILKYLDEDGDMVSLTDDVDVKHAISISKVLRVTVYDKVTIPPPGAPVASTLSEDQKKSILNELENIKKRISSLQASFEVVETKESSDKAEEKSAGRPLSKADIAELLEEKKEILVSVPEVQSTAPATNISATASPNPGRQGSVSGGSISNANQASPAPQQPTSTYSSNSTSTVNQPPAPQFTGSTTAPQYQNANPQATHHYSQSQGQAYHPYPGVAPVGLPTTAAAAQPQAAQTFQPNQQQQQHYYYAANQGNQSYMGQPQAAPYNQGQIYASGQMQNQQPQQQQQLPNPSYNQAYSGQGSFAGSNPPPYPPRKQQ